MTKQPLNVAIAGCGKVAHLHAKAVKESDRLNLVAAWSRTPGSADRFARQYGLKPYRDIPRMVADGKVDVVIVCTPHPFHREPCVLAAEAGAHVLVEKPLASSLEDCDAMIEVCRVNKVKLGVISQRRWYPPALRIKQAIDDGKISTPALGTVTMLGWRDREYYDADAWRGTWDMEGGGVLVNQSPHQLDLLLWYMGDIEEVFGIWENVNHPYIEVEDTALAIIRFKNGALGNILVSNSQKPGIYGKVHVHGKNGASVGVQTESGAMFIAGRTGIGEPPFNDIWTVPGEEHLPQEWQKEDARLFAEVDPTVWFIKQQIEDFGDAVLEGREPMVTGMFGRKTVELFNAIYQSQKEGKPVKCSL